MLLFWPLHKQKEPEVTNVVIRDDEVNDLNTNKGMKKYNVERKNEFFIEV